MPFEPVDPKVSFPHLEERILAFWKQADVFHRSLVAREGAPRWVFYEGPPTANAQPGIHHVEPRTFKDVFPRFKTMTGHYVERKGGWDHAHASALGKAWRSSTRLAERPFSSAMRM